MECGEINCGYLSRESVKKSPVENFKILHNRLWRKSACPVLLFSTFPHKIPLLRLLLQKPMILYIFLFIIFYSLFSLLDVVMNIFNFGQFAFVINDLKNKEVQQNKDSVEGQSDYPCLIWILIKLCNFFKRL